jgi:Concanavalin A-like lectin/glucanases superfamily
MSEASSVASGTLGAIAMSIALTVACSHGSDESWPTDVTIEAHGAQLTIGTLRSVNGSYGGGCTNRSGNWTALVDSGATPDHDLLSVVMGDSACQLTLTSIRTATALYQADPAIVLSDTYQALASAFQDSGGPLEFYGNAKLSSLAFGGDFSVSLLLSADATLASTSRAAAYSYATVIAPNAPLSWWRLSESAGATTMSDAQGVTSGTYVNGVTLGVAGALGAVDNTAAQFDGLNDYVTVARTISDDFSIEFWFKSTGGVGSGSQWYNAAGLVDAEVGGVTNDFGVSLRADGRILAGVGNPDVTIVSSTGGYNNGQWHHVVFTRTRSSGATRLYVDAQLQGSATGGTQSLNAPPSIAFGRLQTGIQYYAGTLDEVALYTSVLSAADVTAHYQAR